MRSQPRPPFPEVCTPHSTRNPTKLRLGDFATPPRVLSKQSFVWRNEVVSLCAQLFVQRLWTSVLQKVYSLFLPRPPNQRQLQRSLLPSGLDPTRTAWF